MSQTPSEATGANIRAELARRGVTQKQLADVLQVSQGQVTKRLRGLIAFDINELVAIAEFLDVDLAVLMPQERAAS